MKTVSINIFYTVVPELYKTPLLKWSLSHMKEDRSDQTVMMKRDS